MSRRRWTDDNPPPHWTANCWILFSVACAAVGAITLTYTLRAL